jgi:hypothetical protein
MFWCIPTKCGDYRLEEVNPHQCRLTVEAPTSVEKRVIDAFLAYARLLEWTARKRVGKGVVLSTPIAPAAARLATLALEGREAWTAIRSTGGNIELIESVPEELPEGTEIAATVRKPRRGCPAPEPAARRANEVLRAFCTRSQYDSFNRAGFMAIIGNLSGERYHLFHRDEANKRGYGHVLVNSQGREVCVWDNGLPAEEEALSIKLAIEHRENWIIRDGKAYAGLGQGSDG